MSDLPHSLVTAAPREDGTSDVDRQLVQDTLAVLAQGAALIASATPTQYAEPGPALSIAPLGAHYRHHLEHVALALDGLEGREIDYDARSRDPAVEREPQKALAWTEALAARVARLEGTDLDRAVTVWQRCGSGDGGRRAMTSTVARELGFLVSHAVHHYAMMRVVADAHGVRASDTLGVMPSTLRHLAKAAPPCS